MIFDGLHFNIQIQLPSFPGSQDIEKEVEMATRAGNGYGLIMERLEILVK